jgi:hypothetical protein
MRFQHFLSVGLASCLLALPAAGPASAQQTQRHPAAKPAPAKAAAPAKPAAQKPSGKGASKEAKGASKEAKEAPKEAAKTSGKDRSAGKAGSAAPAAASPGGVPATLVASFGDWGVYTAQSGRTKICYALTQPKDRLPKNVNRDPAYLFVSFRPAENVKNEVAFVMGFPTRESGAAEASIGSANYALLTKDANAWLKNPAEEGQAISTMAKGQALVVKAQSARGTQLTDRYSLSGFTKALERARQECS